MSRRDAGPAGQSARHARTRLQATLGPPSGLLSDGDGAETFEYRDAEELRQEGSGNITAAGSARPGPALRWRLGLRVGVLVGILAIVAGTVFWWQTASGRPEILPLSGVSPGETTAGDDTAAEGGPATRPDEDAGNGSAGGPAAPDAAATVVVHVAGAVNSPGVVHLPAGSRVHEAIGAAGGGTPDGDLNRLNLALLVEDGQKIFVPRHGEELPPGPGTPAAAGATPGGAAGTPGQKINLNTAGAAELDSLPKVGPVLAQRIVDWRTDHGPFKSIEELDAVDGVGPKMLEALLPLVTV